MYKINKITPDSAYFLKSMVGIANIPKSLYFCGKLPTNRPPTVAIVGTRKPSAYGREVTYRLSYELARQGVVVLSGLALGIDAIAHTAALDAGGVTIAIMPGSAGEVYPKSHQALARRILQSGGALLSEFCEHTNIFPSHFVRRSRIVAALADGVLVTEAAIQSGTIHTAGFALDYGRPVMAVPGHITHPMGGGANRLIATGARLITSAADVLEEIGSAHTRQQVPLPLAENAYEHAILTLIGQGVRDGESLQKQSQLEPALFSQTLTMLEITNKIRPLGGNQWSL